MIFTNDTKKDDKKFIPDKIVGNILHLSPEASQQPRPPSGWGQGRRGQSTSHGDGPHCGHGIETAWLV